jgi:pimeloyl-ACP methyl ester carboxylesterase
MIAGAAQITLDIGGLKFSAWEMGRGPLALCLHGFPDTPATWGALLPQLAEAGFRAVAVQTRGYEPSSQPANGDYSMAALSGDVINWIDALGETRAHLIGHDWGSSIAHIAAARAPDRIASLAALAVPHPTGFGAYVATDYAQLERSWYIFLFQVPGMADAIVAADDFAFLEHLWRRWSPGWPPDAAALQAMRAAFVTPGVLAAALGYYRTAFDAAHPRAVESAALSIAPLRCPVLGLHGARDGCIGPAAFDASMTKGLIQGDLTLERWDDAGHFLHLEHPDRTAERLVRWLGSAR